MDQVPHGSNLERSGSSVSLESVQNRLDALPRVIQTIIVTFAYAQIHGKTGYH